MSGQVAAALRSLGGRRMRNPAVLAVGPSYSWNRIGCGSGIALALAIPRGYIGYGVGCRARTLCAEDRAGLWWGTGVLTVMGQV